MWTISKFLREDAGGCEEIIAFWHCLSQLVVCDRPPRIEIFETWHDLAVLAISMKSQSWMVTGCGVSTRLQADVYNIDLSKPTNQVAQETSPRDWKWPMRILMAKYCETCNKDLNAPKRTNRRPSTDFRIQTDESNVGKVNCIGKWYSEVLCWDGIVNYAVNHTMGWGMYYTTHPFYLIFLGFSWALPQPFSPPIFTRLPNPEYDSFRHSTPPPRNGPYIAEREEKWHLAGIWTVGEKASKCLHAIV